MGKKNYYAVKKGYNLGIYKTWEECQKEILHYPGAIYKGFGTLEEAKAFMKGIKDYSIPIIPKNEEVDRMIEEMLMIEESRSKKETIPVIITTDNNNDNNDDANDIINFIDNFANNNINNDIKDTEWAIYTDGSYIEGKCGWSFIACNYGIITDEISGVIFSKDAAKYRNITGELEAVIQAVLWADKRKNIERFTIIHDYKGISEWAEGRWKTNTELTKFYAGFMKKYRGRITFKKVNGHTGVEGNELADRLAKKALGIE